MTEDLPILLYDGECGLCRGSIRFIMNHGGMNSLRFVPFDSEAGVELCRTHGIVREVVRSMVLIRKGGMLIRSDAVLAVAAELRQPWCLAGWLRVIPRRLRDAVYGFISRNRYRWSRPAGECRLGKG